MDRDSYPTRLVQIKGARVVKQFEVPLASASLNKGDVFILDQGLKLFYFAGDGASKQEKTKGFEVLSSINNSRGKKCSVVWCTDVEGSGNDTVSPDDLNEFWSALGEDSAILMEELPQGASDDTVTATDTSLELFKISNEDGPISFTAITEDDVLVKKKLNRKYLDTNDVFMILCSEGIYIWVGRGSNVEEKKEATNYAVQYIKDKDLPSNTKVTRVMERNESNPFKGKRSIFIRDFK